MSISALFPISDLDLILQIHTRSDTVTVEILIYFKSTPDRVPRPDKTRITLLNGFWRLRPLGPEQTLVETYGRSTIDDLPSWLVNLFLHHTPKVTMERFKKIVEE